jgi:ribosome biogenesis GTPase A
MTGEAIQWYPGHMARAMRRLADDLRIVDLVIEVIDARVPSAGANPALDRIAAHKSRLRVLTREDLADPEKMERWLERFRRRGSTVAFAAREPSGPARLRAAVTAAALGLRSARAIVLGIPNAGKSTVINALAGRKVARTEDRAGVTRAAQWFRVGAGLEVMDTAGILVPRIETSEAQWRLALVGAVPRARFDAEDVVARFQHWAETTLGANAVPDLETFAQSRGFVRRGNLIDGHNAAWAYLKEFNDGRFGRMTLEEPPS